MAIQNTINRVVSNWGQSGTVVWPDSEDLMNLSAPASDNSVTVSIIMGTRRVQLTNAQGWTSVDIAIMPAQTRSLLGATLNVGNTSYQISGERTYQAGRLGQLLTEVTFS